MIQAVFSEQCFGCVFFDRAVRTSRVGHEFSSNLNQSCRTRDSVSAPTLPAPRCVSIVVLKEGIFISVCDDAMAFC